LKPIEEQEIEHPNKSCGGLLLEMKDLLKSKKLYCMIPMFFWTGLELGYWSGEFPTFIQPKSIGLVLALAGVAEVIGGLGLGYLSDRFGSIFVLVIGFLAYAWGLILSILLVSHVPGFHSPVWIDSPWSAYLASLCFGLGDCVFNTQTYILIGTFWRDRTISVFTFFQIFQGLGSAIGFYLPVLLPLKDSSGQFYIQATFLTLATACAICADIFNSNKPVPTIVQIQRNKTTSETQSN